MLARLPASPFVGSVAEAVEVRDTIGDRVIMRYSVIVAGIIFSLDTIYAAWFWREPRAAIHWPLYSGSVIATFIAFWWLLRRAGVSLTGASILYDVIAVTIWYAGLLIWREEAVTPLQTVGVVLVFIGTLLVSI